jgi:hypothetical protein
MHCFKLLGERVMAREFDRQVAELQIRAVILNRFVALGNPETQRIAQTPTIKEEMLTPNPFAQRSRGRPIWSSEGRTPQSSSHDPSRHLPVHQPGGEQPV